MPNTCLPKNLVHLDEKKALRIVHVKPAAGAESTSRCSNSNPIRESSSLHTSTVQKKMAEAKYEQYSKFASLASWAVNWLLLGIKAYAAFTTDSKSVIASLADSGADLISQAIISAAEYYKNKMSPNYPVGRARVEDMSVLACAAVMILISIEVVQDSGTKIDEGLSGKREVFIFGPVDIAILAIGIGLKFVLWLYCGWANKYLRSDAIQALTEDHFNDLLSNSAAISAAIIASHVKGSWWVDPVGAILLMLFIAWRWAVIIYEQMKKIVGHSAPDSFIDSIDCMCRDHHIAIAPDSIIAYHFGAKFIVEIEALLPMDMQLSEAYDIYKSLKDKVEDMDDVARCHIRIDHVSREDPVHKIERELGLQRIRRPPKEIPRNVASPQSRPVAPRRNSYFGNLSSNSTH